MSQAEHLQLALNQAKSRRGFTAPNPAVGAVVVKDGRVLAKGRHFSAGAQHAEVDALNKVGEQAQGADLYVTLEPCCHHGKTPPCTDLIIKRGIANVIYGFPDPNPLVSGSGERALRQAGIGVNKIELPEITEFYQSYTHWMLTKRPFVTAKLALSLDGKIAGSNGEPIQITGSECQRFTHQMRLQSDAILTTAKTIINDNPQLNVRLAETITKPIYILDTHLQTSLNAQVFSTSHQVTLLHSQTANPKPFNTQNIRCLPISKTDYGLTWEEVLDQIGKDGIHDLWIEAGGRCFQSIHQAELTNKTYLYLAPKALGLQAKPAFDKSFDVISKATGVKWQKQGCDAVCEINFDHKAK